MHDERFRQRGRFQSPPVAWQYLREAELTRERAWPPVQFTSPARPGVGDERVDVVAQFLERRNPPRRTHFRSSVSRGVWQRPVGRREDGKGRRFRTEDRGELACYASACRAGLQLSAGLSNSSAFRASPVTFRGERLPRGTVAYVPRPVGSALVVLPGVAHLRSKWSTCMAISLATTFCRIAGGRLVGYSLSSLTYVSSWPRASDFIVASSSATPLA